MCPQHDRCYSPRHGIEPAPDQNRKTTWKEFLRRHRELLVAADFFTTEVWTSKGLTLSDPILHWSVYQKSRDRENCLAREWSMDESGGPQRDPCGGRHPKWQALPDPASRSAFHRGISEHSESVGLHCVKLPSRSPNLNAYGERLSDPSRNRASTVWYCLASSRSAAQSANS